MQSKLLLYYGLVQNKWRFQNCHTNLTIAHNKWSREMCVCGITLGIFDLQMLKISRLCVKRFSSCVEKKGNFFTCFSVTFCFSLLHITEIFHLYLFCHKSLCFFCCITMFGKDEHQKLKVNNVLVPEKAYIQ